MGAIYLFGTIAAWIVIVIKASKCKEAANESTPFPLIFWAMFVAPFVAILWPILLIPFIASLRKN